MEAPMSTLRSRQPLSRPVAHFFVVFLVSLFTVLAACGGDGKKQKIPVPVLNSVSPTSVTAGASAFTLTLNGL
jgi:hypothetical protein